MIKSKYCNDKTFSFASDIMKKEYGDDWIKKYRYWEVITDRITKKGNTIVYLYIVDQNYINEVPDLKGRYFGIRVKSKSGKMYNTYLS